LFGVKSVAIAPTTALIRWLRLRKRLILLGQVGIGCLSLMESWIQERLYWLTVWLAMLLSNDVSISGLYPAIPGVARYQPAPSAQNRIGPGTHIPAPAGAQSDGVEMPPVSRQHHCASKSDADKP
jgi:hypothetical protein